MSAAPGIKRTYWQPLSQQEWMEYYGIGQVGQGMTFFQGSQHQRGSGIGSLFGGLLRAVMPMAKTALKTVGREALRAGIGVASDALSGQDVGQAIQERAREGASELVEKAKRKLELQERQPKRRRRQRGRGLGTRLNTPLATIKPINRARAKRPRKKKQDNDILTY